RAPRRTERPARLPGRSSESPSTGTAPSAVASTARRTPLGARPRSSAAGGPVGTGVFGARAGPGGPLALRAGLQYGEQVIIGGGRLGLRWLDRLAAGLSLDQIEHGFPIAVAVAMRLKARAELVDQDLRGGHLRLGGLALGDGDVELADRYEL